MKKDLVFICVQPNNLYYVWQVNTWLESCKEQGILHKVHILIYKPDAHVIWRPEWELLQRYYPEAQFFKYDDKGVKGFLKTYIPLLRPHTLYQHFLAYPELKDKAIFYHDCDIILNKSLDIDKYLDDDINYVSDTVAVSDYMSHKYFESKSKDVLEHMKDEYSSRDILAETAKIVGITKEEIVRNYKNTGGAQYLLKNIDAVFWDRVQGHSLEIVLYLRSVNRKFFENESKGFQSWCADMWAVLWGLWASGRQTRVAPEMSFCWATDEKDKLITNPILHNAGVTSESTIRTMVVHPSGKGKVMVDAPAFYKGRYHDDRTTPFRDEGYVLNILNNEVSQRYCFHTYLQRIRNIQLKYLFTY